MNEPALAWRFLGRMGYAEASVLQERLRAAVLDGEAGAEALLLCEHPQVITLGRSARSSDVLASAQELAERGIALCESTRGGDVTYHGPGQLVAYPVLRLRRGVVAHVEAMARAVIEVARAHGVEARFRRDCPGVWVPFASGERKLAAFGVHVHRRVAIHGVALNVTTSLEAFDLIVPCGLPGTRATSLAEVAGRTIALGDLVPAFAAAFGRALGRAMSRTDTLLSPPRLVE